MGKQILIIAIVFVVLAGSSILYCKYRLIRVVEETAENSYAMQARGAANSGAQYTLKLLLDDMGSEINQTMIKNGAQITLTSQKRIFDSQEISDDTAEANPSSTNNEYEIRSVAVVTDPDGITYEAITVVVYDLADIALEKAEIDIPNEATFHQETEDLPDTFELYEQAYSRLGVIKLWQELPVKTIKNRQHL
ncbi:MAG: hypothetical protein FWG20_02980 [Candidatus Cloacimonetes bacterium]|nr:hypothetical protein [Candidatus Cloacimonadota bacterium]